MTTTNDILTVVVVLIAIPYSLSMVLVKSGYPLEAGVLFGIGCYWLFANIAVDHVESSRLRRYTNTLFAACFAGVGVYTIHVTWQPYIALIAASCGVVSIAVWLRAFKAREVSADAC